MEVNAKYKQSKVGPIPLDWHISPLGRLVRSVEYGSSAKSKGTGRIPVLRMGNLQDGKIDWTDLVFTDNAAEISKYSLRAGDVLFNRTNTVDLVGKTSIYEGEQPAIFAGYLIRINVVPDLLDARFLNYVLNANFSRKHSARVLSVAVGLANINGQKLKTYPIPMPPTKAEQESIAAALSDVDALIGALDQLIAKKRAIKLAAMQQLLTGKTRLPGFSGDWVTRRVGDLLSFLATANNPRKDLSREGDLRYIHYGDVHAHATPVLDCTATDLPMIAGNKVGSATPLEDGDLVFVDASEDMVGVGKSVEVCNLTGVGVVAGLHTIACRGSDEDWAKGFKAYLQFIPAFKHALERVATGISVYAISKRQIAEVELPLPPATEQAAITLVLSDMDAEIAALEQRRDKTKAIKQGMMQALLTGRVRLVKPAGGGGEST